KSIILILLSLILIFNFVTLPQKAEAIAFTLGGIAITYKVAEAIYLFVLASAAVGVTYATWEEAKNVYEIYEGTSPGPLDNPEWQEKADEVKQSKADIASDYWFDQWELEDIPGGGSDPDPGNDNKRSILGLIGGAGIMSVVLNKFKDLFRTLDIEEGENLISEDLVTQMKRDNVLFEIIRSSNGSAVMLYINGVRVSTSSSLSPNQLYGKLISVSKTDVDYIINWKVRMYNPETGIWDPFSDRETIKKISSVPNLYPDGVPPIEGPKGHNFTVKPNSPVLDSGPYLRKPQQPNLIPIRRIQPTILPDGSKEIVYKEGIDELIKDVVLNTPIDKILNPEPYPYSIVPGDNGEVIIKPEIDPTVPYPDPLPAPDIPYPDPSLPPGINPGEYPGPGPYPWLPPLPEPGIEPGQYPGPGPYPFPDPDAPPMTEVDPGFMINYIPWLKVIINWLSMIWHKIPWVPEVD
ncbi:MAG TPA: hypothetical protein VFC79_10205, partial [Tissierellaceae bacterium]|nr:hypothetical protein [Tissierellaceae bacterium]